MHASSIHKTRKHMPAQQRKDLYLVPHYRVEGLSGVCVSGNWDQEPGIGGFVFSLLCHLDYCSRAMVKCLYLRGETVST